MATPNAALVPDIRSGREPRVAGALVVHIAYPGGSVLSTVDAAHHWDWWAQIAEENPRLVLAVEDLSVAASER